MIIFLLIIVLSLLFRLSVLCVVKKTKEPFFLHPNTFSYGFIVCTNC